VPNTQSLENQILNAYGALLDSADLARLLGYPSTDAVRTARKRGKLPVPMFKLPNRKGWFANSNEVARWLKTVSKEENPRPFNAMEK
jgi:hypothetical protein